MLKTDYRTYLIGFTNSNTKFILQDRVQLQHLSALAQESGWNVDIDDVRELNAYHRFVTSKNKPTWLMEGLLKEALRVKEQNVKLKNEM